MKPPGSLAGRFRGHRVLVVIGAVWVLGLLTAIVLWGWLNYESDPSPEAGVAFGAAIVSYVLTGATVVLAYGAYHQLPLALAAARRAAAVGTLISAIDAGGNDATANPVVARASQMIITLSWTDADGNPVPIGTTALTRASVGGFSASTSSNDLGNTTHVFVAPVTAGAALVTFQVDAAVVQFAIAVV